MVEIIRLQDPVIRAREYLGSFVPPESGPFLDVPPDWKWGPLLVTLADVGGDGPRDVVLDDARLMVEVSHRNSEEASKWCRNIHGLLRFWRDITSDKTVTFLRTVQRPTYTPDDETRTPAYSTIVDLSFRADRHDVPKISDS